VTPRQFRAPPVAGENPTRPAPTFSVIVAAHNAAETLSEAVESALAQTLPPVELIVCDDGSTDGTAVALEPYRDRITYLRKERGGAASARNAALAIAKGEFLAVLDADDAYLPERLEGLADLGSARPDLDLLCTDAFFELDGRVVGTFGETCPFEIVDQAAAILERCFCAWPAIRRTTLLRVGGFDESLRTGSDWECAIRLLHAGAAAGLVDEPLYRYRVHGASLTADRVRTLQDRVSFLERVAHTYDLRESERASLTASLAAQRASLVLTEAEAALRARTPDARSRAFAAVRSPGVAFRSRAAALAAGLAPRTAARTLERRARGGGSSRLGRSLPRG
jgi:hypothetical protein